MERRSGHDDWRVGAWVSVRVRLSVSLCVHMGPKCENRSPTGGRATENLPRRHRRYTAGAPSRVTKVTPKLSYDTATTPKTPTTPTMATMQRNAETMYEYLKFIAPIRSHPCVYVVTVTRNENSPPPETVNSPWALSNGACSSHRTQRTQRAQRTQRNQQTQRTQRTQRA